MKARRRNAGVGVAFAIIAALGAMTYIRLAPSDPADWHIDMAAPGFAPGANWAAFCPVPGARFAPENPAETLAGLDVIALASPNTTRLAGSPGDGHVTWITRSTLMGYPDYTTAQILDTAQGPRLCILARQRFGVDDFGVNAARITGWMQQALGLPENPGQIPY
jgi:Protein of unknown function (DUF1499)